MLNTNTKIKNNLSEYINYIHNGVSHTIRKSYHIKFERQEQRQVIDRQIISSIKSATKLFTKCINHYVWIINYINNTSVCIYVEENKFNDNSFFIHATTILNKTDIFIRENDIKITIKKNID